MTKFSATSEDIGRRLDQFLTGALDGTSRSRVQQLIEQEQVQVNGKTIGKSSLKLEGGETIEILGEVELAPLHAEAEDIPLRIVYEDDDLAVIDKAAGMMVHSGAGATADARSKGTLVNALLHHMSKLSKVGGDLRPGIVHRLDRETSGLVLVAKNDRSHRKLAAQFEERTVRKIYLALVQGWPKVDQLTINKPIVRDPKWRRKMTSKSPGGRDAVSHFEVKERIDSDFGKFALLQVKIDTGRTHQIRVHLADHGFPVAGDALYGGKQEFSAVHPQLRTPHTKVTTGRKPATHLGRQFLHAAELEFVHPKTGKRRRFVAELPEDLQQFITLVRGK